MIRKRREVFGIPDIRPTDGGSPGEDLESRYIDRAKQPMSEFPDDPPR